MHIYVSTSSHGFFLKIAFAKLTLFFEKNKPLQTGRQKCSYFLKVRSKMRFLLMGFSNILLLSILFFCILIFFLKVFPWRFLRFLIVWTRRMCNALHRTNLIPLALVLLDVISEIYEYFSSIYTLSRQTFKNNVR